MFCIQHKTFIANFYRVFFRKSPGQNTKYIHIKSNLINVQCDNTVVLTVLSFFTESMESAVFVGKNNLSLRL